MRACFILYDCFIPFMFFWRPLPPAACCSCRCYATRVFRYMASKLWEGETYFMQIDAHSLFIQGWDTTLVKDINK